MFNSFKEIIRAIHPVFSESFDDFFSFGTDSFGVNQGSRFLPSITVVSFADGTMESIIVLVSEETIQ